MRRLMIFGVLLLLGGCAYLASEAGVVPLPGTGGAGGDLERPPDIVVRGADETVRLAPYTFCWSNGCVDGIPPDHPPDIGAEPALAVEFPAEDWQFSATFRRAGDPCAGTQTIDLQRRSATTFALPPAGFAGTYDVDVSGRSTSGRGDVFARFRWTTLSDGALPDPEAQLGILADRDGTPDSYGVEMYVGNLPRTPEQVDATITVTAADGESLSFTPTRSEVAANGCRSVEGALAWDGPDSAGQRAATLGPAPFTYEVILVLDGETYHGSATWPDDTIPDHEPNASLTFTPSLPAVSAGGS